MKDTIFKEEKRRLKTTIQRVKHVLSENMQIRKELEGEIGKLRTEYSTDNYQDYIDLTISMNALAVSIRNIRGFGFAVEKPYFARIDFRENGTNKLQKLYIGKISLSDDYKNIPLIIDWRTPIANLYYEGRIGESYYDCIDGRITGELSLKRQFFIEKGKLENFYDIDLATNDPLLQESIQANTENKLKDIASTIQAEQNRIIRADMWKPLIVQGAAGSGKTTVALHRIAYIIYNYNKEFKPESFMIIGPNRFFLDYISEVLPELGVEAVGQTTYLDLVMKIIGKNIRIDNPNKVLDDYSDFSSCEFKENEAIYKFKSSLIYKDIIEVYIKKIVSEILPKEDIKIGQYVVVKYEEIESLFMNYYAYLPYMKRLHEVKKHLQQMIIPNMEKLMEYIYEDCSSNVKKLKIKFKDSKERQKTIIQIFNKRDERIKIIKEKEKSIIKDYFKKIKKKTAINIYNDFISTFCSEYNNNEYKEILKKVQAFTSQNLSTRHYNITDIAPIIYIHERLYGLKEESPLRHIIIDEAQDLSMFQIFSLTQIAPRSSFTILGDICQGIHSYKGISDWHTVTKQIFREQECDIKVLKQSYRNTIETMEGATSVINNFSAFMPYLAEPVIRHGNNIDVRGFTTNELLIESTIIIINEYLKNNHKSIGVICKSLKSSKVLYKKLIKMNIEANLITGKEDKFEGGISILPIYYAKGLEFDNVIITDGDSETYKNNEMDAKLLYVAMTRPIHNLHIFYTRKRTSLLH